jgi:hypothetical protein
MSSPEFKIFLAAAKIACIVISQHSADKTLENSAPCQTDSFPPSRSPQKTFLSFHPTKKAGFDGIISSLHIDNPSGAW